VRAPLTRRDRAALALLLAAYLVYALLFILRTSFVVGGERYFSLFDDGMVSMRYAKNFAHGFGLVWNAGGDRVEGYTNLLWVLYMAAAHRLPIAASKIAVVIQATNAGFLAINLYVVSRIALAISDRSRAVQCAGVVLTALYLPINNWSLQGMEVGALVLLTTAASWLAIRTLTTGMFARALYPLLAAGTLIRPDMIVPFVAILIFLLAADPALRWKHLAWGAPLLVAALVAQTAFRIWYYGALLPNTYYLKMTGVPASIRIARGAYVLAQFVWRFNPLLFALPFALAFRRDRRIWLLLWVLAAQMAYSVWVGGDAWEYWGGSNRFISIAMPGFFVLLAFALEQLTGALVAAIHPAPEPTGARLRAAHWWLAAAVAYAVVSVNSIYGPAALKEMLLITPPLHSGPGGENQDDVETALAVRRITTPDASIAVMRAGTIPYFAERPGVDLLGKSDRHIAHERARHSLGFADFRDFRPGHMKFDFAYSIGEKQPDVIVQLRRREALAQPYLQDYAAVPLDGGCAYVKRASPRVLWNQMPAGTCSDE